MISAGIKKLAKENDLKISSGVAYGNLYGFASTFSEGNGYKRLVIVTTLPYPDWERWLKAELDNTNIEREYRVKSISFNVKTIEIEFRDAAGTMKRINAFIEWFYPILEKAYATKCKICAECGQPIEKGTWKLIDGVVYPLHKDCAIQLRNTLIEEHETEMAEQKGSYLMGFIGAILGAAIGAALWAGVYYMGYMASIVGFVIGILAERGYNLFKGKKGGLKVAILIVLVIAGVAVGTLAGEWLLLYKMMQEGELIGYTAKDLLPLLFEIIEVEEEATAAVLKNIGTGVLFAALGVFALIRKTAKEAKPTKVKDLKD